MMKNYRTRLLVGVMTLAAWGAMPAWGEGTGTPVKMADTSDLLAPEYKDAAHGIRICPPAGSRMAERAGDEVLSFVNDQKQWAGGVRFVYLKKDVHMSLEQYLKSNADAMNTTFKGVSIEKSEVIKVGDRKAGRQISAFDVQQETIPGHPEHIPYYKMDVMIEIAKDQFVHVTLFCPLKDKEQGLKTFDLMLDTFKLMDVNQERAQRDTNLINGLNWLKPMTADQLKGKLVSGPQYLRIVVQGRELGYLRMEESEETQQGLAGLVVRVKSFTFQKDGTTLTSDNKAWWAYMLKDGEPNMDALGKTSWESVVRSIPGMGAANGKWLWERETGKTWFNMDARGQRPGEENEIHPAVILHVDTDDGEDQAMDLRLATPGNHEWAMDERSPRPLPKAMEYLWPRVVDLGKPVTMSFPVFNSGTRKMGMRTLSVIGEEAVSIDGQTVKAVHVTDEMDNGTTSTWVDRQGRTLMMRTSDGTTLLPTPQGEISQKFGEKLRKAGLGG